MASPGSTGASGEQHGLSHWEGPPTSTTPPVTEPVVPPGDGGAGGDAGLEPAVSITAGCDPGEKRWAPCGCGIDRLDICGADRNWQEGPCDGCPDREPSPCGFCGHTDAQGNCVDAGECKPGDVDFRRCDACPDSAGCGPTTCVGEKWQCSASCSWEKIEGCEIRERACEGDATRLEPCGACGSQQLECDGCFWRYGNCIEQGECFPGSSRTLPCFDEACAEGFGAVTYCGATCQWTDPLWCQGCSPGAHRESQLCFPGYPACGTRTVETVCTLEAPAGNGCGVAIGRVTGYSTVEPCPPFLCYPGQSEARSCTLADGRGGSETRRCSNSCDWGSWGACGGNSSSCVPGNTQSESLPCGCGVHYTRSRTCKSDGTWGAWTSSGQGACPECATPGQSWSEPCAGGSCGGSLTVSCDSSCNLVRGSCTAAPQLCTPGATQQRSCSSTCGPGHMSWQCRSDGCGWQPTGGACIPDQEPACSAGQTKSVTCNPPGCPQRQDVCSSSCQWVEGSCPPCG